jgi:sarcosine oxidase, subunit gamma
MTKTGKPQMCSPLQHREPLAAGAAVTLVECPFQGLLMLRGGLDQMDVPARKCLGMSLPKKVGTITGDATVSAICFGPDEWLLVTGSEDEHSLHAKLSAELEGLHHQLVNVSDYYTTIELSGINARELLAKLVVIDLHPRAFAAGHAVATLLARANVWLWLNGGRDGGLDPSFRIVVRRSLADYVWCLLSEAGREWGLPMQLPIGRVKLRLPHLEG